jgi:hypothetical protein
VLSKGHPRSRTTLREYTWAWIGREAKHQCTAEVHGMSHEIAKLLLEHAETFLERTEAVKAALSLGMPLNEIQDYLDWLDALRGTTRQPPAPQAPPAANPPNVRPADLTGNEGG